VANGDTLLAPPIARRLVECQLGASRTRLALRPRFNTLTERERDIVRRLAHGLSNAALAQELGLSEATIKTHVTRLLSKLDVRSRVQAVVLAYESGFVRPGHTGEAEL
jgi:DNA-binding NarL/FixJ family response regulator